MRHTALFSKTRKEAPKDEVARNAELLIRAGYIHKELAGVYSYLPLGLRTLERIVGIIREEMNALGANEVYLSALQDRAVWEATGRWSDEAVDNWFKTELKNGTTAGLGFTHEEPLTRLMREHVSSYRDLPRAVYQFQTKFRNEQRAKSGLLRGREFLMKDLYSFCRTEAEHQEFYARVRTAYQRIFDRVGLGAVTYVTFASGGVFSKFSEEFQTVCAAGEDTIHLDEETGIAVNKEVFTDDVLKELGLDRKRLVERTAIEVGNIFTLGTRFSEALGLTYKNEAGESLPVFMGSYGIGPGRLLGTIVEVHGDERGLVWPRSVAPFAAHLIGLGDAGESMVAAKLHDTLATAGIDVLYDDRDLRAGEKFADADLLGLPYRLVVGGQVPAGSVEVKERATGTVTVIPETEVLTRLTS